MTRAKMMTLMGIGLLSLSTGAIGVARAAAQEVAGAETSGLRPLRPGDALRNAAELHRKGDYEAAERNLQQAGKGRAQMNAADQTRLDDLMKQNKQALAARKRIDQQLDEAEEAAKEGRANDAASALNSVKANKYASAKHQERVNEITEQMTPARRGRFANMFTRNKSPGKPVAKPENTDAKKAQAKDLLQEAHECVVAGDLLKARQLVKQAEDLKVEIPWWELTPEKVRGEIAQAEMKQGTGVVARTSFEEKARPVKEKETVRPASPAEAKQLVKDARKALEQGNLDQAEEMAKTARMTPGVKYSLFDETPDKVLNDLNKAREVDNQARAADLLKQARRQMETAKTAEDFDDAEKLTYQSEKLRSTYPLIYRGDRPEKLRAEIIAKKKGTIKPTLPPMEGSYARKPMRTKPEAGGVELASAKEKPATRTAREGGDRPPPPAMKSPVPPPPAVPPAVVMEEKADEGVVIEVGRPMPPSVAKTPSAARSVARSVAQSVAQPVAQRPVRAGSNDEGYKLITQAEQELVKGNVIEARKLAEAAYGSAIVKPQAEQLLARIDAKQEEVDRARAQQFYDLSVRAFKRKEYAVAASYLSNLNPKLLDDQKRVHAAEMMATEEVKQYGPVAQAVGEEPQEGTSRASDKPAPQTKPGLLSEVQARQAVEMQKARDQKLQAEQQANRLAAQGDLDGAIATLETALVNLKDSGLEADQLAPMRRQLEDRSKRYRTMRERVAFEKMQQQRLTAGRETIAKQHLHETKKNEQVAELLKQHKNLMDEGKYKEAAVVAMKAHEIDPDNPAADMALYKANISFNLHNEHGVMKAQEDSFHRSMVDVNRAAVASVDDSKPMTFPENWRSKDHREKWKSLQVRPATPADKEVKGKLDTSVVSVDFKNKALSEVLDELRTMTGVNIVPDKSNIEVDGISLNQPVTMKLDGVKLSVAMKHILRDCRLTYVIQDGLLLVTTPQGERGRLVQKVFPIADLIVPADGAGEGILGQIPVQSVSDESRNASSTGYNTPYGLTGGTNVSQIMGTHATPTVSKSPRVMNRTIQDVLIKLIQDTVDPASWDTMGGSGHIEYFPLGMSLVVSQTPDIQEQIQLLLDRLRELQELQVTVEVRLLALNEQFFERIGIDFQVKIDDDQTRFERQVVNNSFAPIGQINAPDHLDGVVVGLTPAGTLTSDLDIPIRNSSFQLASPPFGAFPNSTDGSNGGLTTGLAFLSDIEVYLLLEAAQGDRRNNVLQAPKVTLYNGQTASISDQTERLFITDFNVVTDFFGNIIVDPVVTRIPTGLFLTVQAVISADRRYVRLSINPTVITIDPNIPTFELDVGFGPQLVQQPITQILQVQTTVSVPDGGTILLGGIKRLSEGRNEFGPPILNKLPYINRLFKNVGYGREASSVMFMVTPHIIIPEEEEERLGQTFAF